LQIVFEVLRKADEWTGDSRILGFITQAGRPSLQESLYHGVPMITFPIVGGEKKSHFLIKNEELALNSKFNYLPDQDYNALMLEDLGVSINLEILTVSAEQLKDNLAKLISSDQ